MTNIDMIIHIFDIALITQFTSFLSNLHFLAFYLMWREVLLIHY